MNRLSKHTLVGRIAQPMLIICTVLLLLPSPAQAYIGPGAGLGAIAVTVAVILGVIFLIVGLVWFPLKRWVGGRKKRAGSENDSAP